jgi:hypothetical protein
MRGSHDLLHVSDFTPHKTSGEVVVEETIVAAMLATTTRANQTSNTFRSPKMRQRFTTKTVTKAAIIAGVVLFSASAAAAGGVLPHAAQSAVSRAVEHIGIHVENPDKSAKQSDDSTSTSSTVDDKSVTASSIDDNSSTSSSIDDKQNGSSDDAVGHDANDDAVGHDANDDSAVTSSSIDDHGHHAASDDATNTSSSVADDSSTPATGSVHRGLDDTTQSTTATSVSVPSVDPAVTTSSVDDHGGANKGGSKP